MRSKKKIKTMLTYLSFLLPAFIIYGILMIYPMVETFRLSFFDWDGASPIMNFVGLQNYIESFKDPVFKRALLNNFVWMLLSLALMVIPVLILAIMISNVKKGKLFFRAGFFLPNVLSLAVAAVLWGKIYDPSIGPINYLLKRAGLDHLARNWLGDPLTVLPALVIVNCWVFYGLFLVLYMAGLQNVDKSLYEAAELDGAGAVGKFWYVTIPSLRNTLNVVISMIIIYGLKSFPLVWIMTQGGPFYRSELVATYIYRVAFTMNDISYATAASVILAVIIIFITFLFNMIREWGE